MATIQRQQRDWKRLVSFLLFLCFLAVLLQAVAYAVGYGTTMLLAN